jgi:hypothetical protein
MVEAIAFPDVEAAWIAYLKTRITEKVGTVVPSPAPTSYVRVSRTGGVSTLSHDGPTVLFECFGQSTVAAATLVRIVRAHVLAAARQSVTFIRVSDGGGPAYLPDPDTNQPKYQFLVQCTTRGTAL